MWEPLAGRILGVEARFDRVALGPGRHGSLHFIGQGQPLCHQQLQADKVQPGYRLGDRMLDLKAGVHLEEVGTAAASRRIVASIEHELDGAGVHITDGPGGGDRLLGEARSQGGIDHRGRCFLDDLLMTALDAALTFEEGHHTAVLVGHHLDFDVTGGRDQVARGRACRRRRRQPPPAGRSQRPLPTRSVRGPPACHGPPRPPTP